MAKKDYTIGLDIGTNSVGWAIIDDNLKLLKRNMTIKGNTDKKSVKRDLWGSLLYSGNSDKTTSAADARSKRGLRRRLRRRKYRLDRLKQIFSEIINDKAPNFFDKLNESFLNPKDKKYGKYQIFDTKKEEKDYYRRYPTIYHLRKDLIESSKKQDIRLVYLALAHILKSRGNFLFEGNIDDLKKNDFVGIYEEVVELCATINVEDVDLEFEEVDKQSLNSIIKRENISEIEQGLENFADKHVIFKEQNKKKNDLFNNCCKIICGDTVKANNFASELDSELSISFKSDDYVDVIDVIQSGNENIANLLLACRKAYDYIMFNRLVDLNIASPAKLSSNMVSLYNQHEKDLKAYKKLIKEFNKFKRSNGCKDLEMIILTADDIDSFRKKVDKKEGKLNGKNKRITHEQALKKQLKDMKKILEDKNTEAEDKQINDILKMIKSIEERVNKSCFLKNLRSTDNASIPNQIQRQEMEAILDKQAKFYPFLNEHKDELLQLLSFRIPYYVGPLVNKKYSRFAWLVRKEGQVQKITPTNFDGVVDKHKTAEEFMERLIGKDVYLPNERVLPKASLLYQEYCIFNELTKVAYIDSTGKKNNFSSEEKLNIFEKLFKTKREVTKTDLCKCLNNVCKLKEKVKETEIIGIKAKFNAKYSTYHDLKKINGMEQLIADEEGKPLCEDIISILTIFEDKDIRLVRLKELLCQNEDLINKFSLSAEKLAKVLSTKHYKGFGNVSAKLINGIRDKNCKTILDYLIEDDKEAYYGRNNPNRNLMQLVNDSRLAFKEQIDREQNTHLEDLSLDEFLDDLYVSPSIRRGIRLTIRLVDELVEIMGYLPKNIVLEMPREDGEKGKIADTRYSKLEEMLKKDAALEDLYRVLKTYEKNKKALANDALYLYFLQNGRDMYTGKEINLSELHSYDIDHIIPKSFKYDDSLDNKVLTAKKMNMDKRTGALDHNIIENQCGFWRVLLQQDKISLEKYTNLMKTEFTEADKAGFIMRQLVETRQITKFVARYLDNKFNGLISDPNDKVNILLPRASLCHQFRETFGFYKVRELNDMHHAHDAYLNAVIANTLNKNAYLSDLLKYGAYSKYKKNGFNNSNGIMDYFGNTQFNCLFVVERTLDKCRVNIVKHPETASGEFYNETIQKNKVNGGSSTRSLKSSVKVLQNTEQYGGFTNVNNAYFILFDYKAKSKLKRKLIGVPIVDRQKFEQDPVTYLEAKGFDEPKLVQKLLKYTLLEYEDGKRRYLTGVTGKRCELVRANQLLLPRNMMALLHHLQEWQKHDFGIKDMTKVIKNTNNIEAKFDKLFEHMMKFIDKYSEPPKIVSSKISEEYHKLRESLCQDDNKIKIYAEIGKALLSLLHLVDSKSACVFKFSGLEVNRIRYQSINEKKEPVIIFQSLSGLRESRYKYNQ